MKACPVFDLTDPSNVMTFPPLEIDVVIILRLHKQSFKSYPVVMYVSDFKNQQQLRQN